MKNNLNIPNFENRLNRTQTILGWVYLPVHMFAIPLLLGMYASFLPGGLSTSDGNLIYYAVGMAFTLIVMWGYLRSCFDVFLDNLKLCAFTLLLALGLDYLLSVAMTAVLMVLEQAAGQTPNDQALMDIAVTDAGLVKGIVVYMAPLVEETLFRGVVFGSLRGKNRVLAYVVSIALFSFAHVWQAAVVSMSLAPLIYAIRYVPVSFVLTWSYDRTGSIWVPIIFHMFINALSLTVLSML